MWPGSLKAQRCCHIVVQYGDLTALDLETEELKRSSRISNPTAMGGGGAGGVFSSLTHHAGTFRLSQFLWYEVSRLEQTGLPITPSFSIYDPHPDSQCPSTCPLSEPNNLAFSDDTHQNITHTISCTFRSHLERLNPVERRSLF